MKFVNKKTHMFFQFATLTHHFGVVGLQSSARKNLMLVGRGKDSPSWNVQFICNTTL